MSPIVRYYRSVAAAMIVAALVCSCHHDTPAPVTIHRLDLAIEDFADSDDGTRRQLCDSFSGGVSAMVYLLSDTTDSYRLLDSLSRSRSVRMFMPDVRHRLADLGPIETELGEMRRNFADRLTEIHFPTLYSIVSPFNQSIFGVDTVMLVALNHYLGNDYEGYSYFEPYQRLKKHPAHISYDIAEATIASAYPYIAGGQSTALSRMLYEGALVTALMEVVPDASLSEALGYTDLQTKWAQDNESLAWNAIVTRQLLYSTDPLIADRLTQPSPSTTIIHPDSPGRLGRYIGYRIVQSYIDHNPGVGLPMLLSPDTYNSQSTLIKAKYSPK